MRRLPVLLILLAACGGDDDGDGGDGSERPDADPDDPDAGQGELTCGPARQHARFTVSSTEAFGSAGGQYDDRPYPSIAEPSVVAGDCGFFAPESYFCDPGCTDGTICTAGEVCKPIPLAVSVGTLHVGGTDPELDLEPTEWNTYYTDDSYAGLYQPGDQVTVSGGGGDTDVEAFEITARGVPELTVPFESLTATEHQDMTVPWDQAADAPDGSRVVLHMDSDHHGAPGYIECWAADDGEVTVAADLIDAIIAVGESGIGTYIENAYIMRVDVGTDDLGGGDCLVFHTESRELIYVETVRDE